MDRRNFLILAAAIGLATPAIAAPRPYRLDRENSTVGFSYQLNGQRLTGRMPVKSASIVLDVDHPSRSRVEAVLNAARANAGPFYATAAMKSSAVLDTDNYPEIRFVSKSIENKLNGARIKGEITIRDITRAIELNATIFRQRGTEVGDRRKMSILMTGRVNRHDFGATGFSNLVAPSIVLNILTRIELDEA
ncbi:MAG: YceI family protein [Boseongicola sp.]